MISYWATLLDQEKQKTKTDGDDWWNKLITTDNYLNLSAHTDSLYFPIAAYVVLKENNIKLDYFLERKAQAKTVYSCLCN